MQRLAVCYGVVLALIFTSACTPSTSPSSSAPETLVLVFQKQKDPAQIADHAKKVADLLSEEIGRRVEVMVPASYGASVQAIVSNKAQVAYMSAIPFLLARKEAPVSILLAEKRAGKSAYTSIFVVRDDAPYKGLEDLKGARMMFTSPTSASGYVMAYSRLVDDKLLAAQQDPAEFFSEVRFAGGYDRALLAVANGQADVAAVSDYTMEGDKADIYLSAETRARLRILTRTPGVPTHLVAVRSDLPVELQSKIKAGLLKLTREAPELLADVYGAAEFVEVSEEQHLEGARRALANTGLRADTLF